MSFDETSTLYDLDYIIAIFRQLKFSKFDTVLSDDFTYYERFNYNKLPSNIARTSEYLVEPQFTMKFSETSMMRYVHRLASKDISLTDTMIPLGSCTMKLNSSIAMIPITWSGFANIHPFVPKDQALGYYQMIQEIEDNLIAITQYDGISMQPQSGA